MHYGFTSNLGLNMKIYLDYIILEVGTSLQPLQESYNKYEKWMTTIWHNLSGINVISLI